MYDLLCVKCVNMYVDHGFSILGYRVSMGRPLIHGICAYIVENLYSGQLVTRNTVLIIELGLKTYYAKIIWFLCP